MVSKAQLRSFAGISALLILILQISIFIPEIKEARAGELLSTYSILDTDYPEYIQRLQEGGASEERIEAFLEDLDAQALALGPLNEENFDSVLYKALKEVIMWRKHRTVFIAMNRSFSEEINFTLQTGILHPDMVPLREAVRISVLGCPVTSVSLNALALTLTTDDGSVTLQAAIEPSNATNQNLSWESSNPAVAEVNAEGRVTILSAGTTSITVRTEDGDKTAACVLTVNNPPAPVTPVTPVNPVTHVSGLELDQTNMTLYIDTIETLIATVIPENASNKELSWLSDNPEIAAADQEGSIRGVSAGTAIITVTTEDGNKKATCTVVVTEAEPPPFEGREWAAQSDIALDHSWTIEFNKMVEQSTVNSSSIYITDSRGNTVPLSFEFSPDYRSIIASPEENYEAGKDYYLHIDSQVKATPFDTDSSSLNEAVRMRFTTVDI